MGARTDDESKNNIRSSNMKTFITALTGQCKNVRIIAAALLTAGAIGGWALAMFATSAVAVEDRSPFALGRKDDAKVPLADFKSRLVGSYAVTGTDPDGKPYPRASVVDIALAPSGALELEWDNGKQVGIAQVIGNLVAVSAMTRGQTAILVMTVNPDGTLSGKWSRRMDRGYKGTETWKKT
jgi:hypothetical protein